MKPIHIPLEVRRWIYGVTLAVIPVLAAYGWLTADKGGLWLAVASALLGLSPATALGHLADPEPRHAADEQ